MAQTFLPWAAELGGLGHGFGGIDAGDDYVVAGVEEVVGDLGGIGGDAGDIEPEPDPRDLELELGRVLLEEVDPGIAGAEIGRGGEAAGLVIDERPEEADLAGLGGEGGCDAGDFLHVLAPCP